MFASATAEAEELKRRYGQITGMTPIAGVPNAATIQTANGGQYKFATPGIQAVQQQMAYQPGKGPMAAPPSNEPVNDNGGAWEPLYSTPDGGVIALRPGGNPENPKDLIKQTPGRAGSKGGMVARGMTVEGGHGIDPKIAAEQEATHLATLKDMEVGRAEAAKFARERQGFMEENKAQLSNERAVLAHENSVKSQRLGELQAKYDKAEKDFADSQMDPMKDPKKAPKMVIGGLISALGASLGALGATVGRTPNFAAEAIERDNERRLRMDEAQMRVKKDVRDNLLGRLRDEMGSMDLAKASYRAIMSKQAAMGFEMLGMKESDSARQHSLFQAAQIERQKYLEHLDKRGQLAEGEVTKTFQNMPGSAGRAASQSAVSLQEHKDAVSIGGAIASTNKTNADAAKIQNAANGAPKLGQRAQGQIVAARNARTAIAEAADAYGMKRNDKGEYENPSLAATVASKIPFSDRRQKTNALKLTFIAEVGKAQTGGVLTEGEAHEMKAQIANADTPGELGALLRHYDHTMAGVEKNVRSVAASSGGDPGRDDEDH
jgi:hypothetical protein